MSLKSKLIVPLNNLDLPKLSHRPSSLIPSLSSNPPLILRLEKTDYDLITRKTLPPPTSDSWRSAGTETRSNDPASSVSSLYWKRWQARNAPMMKSELIIMWYEDLKEDWLSWAGDIESFLLIDCMKTPNYPF